MAIAYHVHDYTIPTATDEEASNGVLDTVALTPANLPSILSTKQAASAALTSLAGLSTSADQIPYTTAENTYATTAITAAGRTLIGLDSASLIRAYLDLEPGVDIQTYDAGLASISGLTTAADQMLYTTGADTYAVTGLSAFSRTVLDDTDATAWRTTLGIAGNMFKAENLSGLADPATALANIGGMGLDTYDPNGIGLDVFGGRATFADIATAQIANVAAFVKEVTLQCRDRTVSVTLGGAPYKRAAAEPPHEMKFRSTDRYLPDGSIDATNGGWWEFAGKLVFPEHAGALGVTGTDDSPALRRALVAASLLGLGVWVARDIYLGSRVYVPSNCHVYGMGGTIYNEHVQAIAGYSQGLFVSENFASDPTTTEIVNVGFHGLRIRDNVLPDDECCFFCFSNVDGFVFEDNDIIKNSVSWNMALAADNFRIVNNTIDTSASGSFSDAIHVLEGKYGVIANNNLKCEDDCIAIHNHSYATLVRGNTLQHITISNNVCFSLIANGLRVGTASSADPDFFISDVTADNNQFYSGIFFRDERATVNNKHYAIKVSGGLCRERIRSLNTAAAWKDITIDNVDVDPTQLYSSGAGVITLDIGTGIETVRVKNCRLNKVAQKDSGGSSANSISSSVKIEFINNDVDMNSTAAAVSISSPVIECEDNTINVLGGNPFRSLYVHGGGSNTTRVKLCGNTLIGTAQRAFSVDASDYLVMSKNTALGTFTTRYALGTITAGHGDISVAGAPTQSLPDGYMALRTDGAAATTLYVRAGGAWVAK